MTNDLDEMEVNKTMEAMEGMDERIKTIDNNINTHMKHHQAEFDRINKQVDGFITDSITFDEELKMRMVNIENAYRLFNITNDFQYSDLRSRINKLQGEQQRVNGHITDLSKVKYNF